MVLVDKVLALQSPGFAAAVSLINTVPSAIRALLGSDSLPAEQRKRYAQKGLANLQRLMRLRSSAAT